MSQMKSIEISLKPIAGGINRVLPPGINQVLQLEYANKYLESIGAYPTRENVDFVLNNLAIKDALVLPVWARSKIIIIPGMNDKDGDIGATVQDLMSENRHDAPIKRYESHQQRSKKQAKQGELELENMMKSAKSSYTNKVGRRMSWATVNTLDLLEPLVSVLQVNQRIAETFKVLMRPPDFDGEDIAEALHAFIMTLPDYIPRVKQDKTFKLFKSVRKLLKSKACVQLYGLLVHFCYWNIIHPTARHTIQSLRDRQPMADTTAFQDLDLNPNGMLMMRATSTAGTNTNTGTAPASPALSGLNTARSALTVEKMFVDEVFLQGMDEQMPRTETHTSSRPGTSSSKISASFNHLPSRVPSSTLSSASNSPTASPGRGFFENMERTTSARKVDFFLSSKNNSQRFGSHSNLNVLEESAASPPRQVKSSLRSRSNSPTLTNSRPQSPMPAEQLRMAMQQADEDSLNESDTEVVRVTEGPSSRASSRASRAASAAAQSRSGKFQDGLNFPQNEFGGNSLSGNTVETEESLSMFEKEQLFMQMETCLIYLFKKVGKKKVDLVTGRQALVTCCHFIVDEALTSAYPWFATLPDGVKQTEHAIHSPAYLDYAGHGADWAGPYADSIKQLNLRLRRLVHQGLADIIDPSRLYTSSMLLSTVTGKANSHSLANKGKSRFYTTSMATKAVLGDTSSDAVRRFLQYGRGAYTVLPGVVDPYTGPGRGTTGVPQTAAHAEIFDILRDTAGTQRNGIDPFATKNTLNNSNSAKLNVGLPLLPHATSAPALTQFDNNNIHAQNTCSGQQSQPMARPHTQQDTSYARGHHATTRTFAERVNSSAARNASTLGPNKCHKFGAGMPKGPTINVPPPQKTKLDFGNLFADQPDIGYFPVLKTGSGARTASRGVSRSMEGASSKQLYQPLEEVDWSKEYLASSKRVNSSAQLNVAGDGNNTDGCLNRSTRTADSALDTFRMPSGFLNTGEGEAGDMGMGQLNIPPGQFDPVPMYPLYPSNGSIGSTSYLSENRSIVHNKSAVMPISLRAKASLMELMVDKTTSLYATEIQTNQVKTRRELLNLNPK